jgi:hypothetical protein
MNRQEIGKVATGLMDIAIELEANNGFRPQRGRAKLTDWILVVVAAAEKLEKK